MKTKLDNQGFTLMEVMVGSALLAIGCMAIADSMILSAKAQRSTVSSSEINGLFDRIQEIATAEWSCTAGLSGAASNGAIVIHDPVDSKTLASEGVGNGRFWSVSQLRLQNIQAVPGQAGVMRGSLFLQASKNRTLTLGNPVVSRTIQDIYFETNPDGTIARCYTTSDTIAAAQSTCTLLGGTWTPGTSSNRGTCHIGS